jgi:hypothetical protein
MPWMLAFFFFFSYRYLHGNLLKNMRYNILLIEKKKSNIPIIGKISLYPWKNQNPYLIFLGLEL